jgi:hypothetical protein
MTYIQEVKELLDACGCQATIYRKQKAVRPAGQVKPLTAAERRQVDRLSTERGYRRFTAERMSAL